MIRYVIATPLALLLLVLMLLLMALLIQPNSTSLTSRPNMVTIDFISAPQSNEPLKTRSAKKVMQEEQNLEPASPPKPTHTLALPKKNPRFETDTISLPRLELTPPTSLSDLDYVVLPPKASPQITEQPSPRQSEDLSTQEPEQFPLQSEELSPQLPEQLSRQFSENLFPLHTPQPTYPRRARSRGIEGWVKLEFTIQVNGKVKAINILDSNPAGIFDNVTRLSVADWVFKPQLLNGLPTQRRVEQTIRFNLKK